MVTIDWTKTYTSASSISQSDHCSNTNEVTAVNVLTEFMIKLVARQDSFALTGDSAHLDAAGRYRELQWAKQTILELLPNNNEFHKVLESIAKGDKR